MISEEMKTQGSGIEERPIRSDRQSSSWDISHAPRNYAVLVFFQVLGAALSLSTVGIIARYAGAELYGAIVAIVAASQVAQVFINWTSASVVRFGVDEFVEKGTIARSFWTRSIVVFFNTVLVVAIGYRWFPDVAPVLKVSPDVLWIVILHLIATVYWVHIQVGLQAAKLLRIQALLQMTERLLIFISIALLAITGHLIFSSVAISYIAAPFVMAVVGIFPLIGYLFTRFEIRVKDVRRMLLYSLPLLPFSFIGYFSGSYVDAIFIASFLSLHDLGVYYVASQINGIALQIPTLANTLLVPLFITLNSEQADERMRSFFRRLLPPIVLGWGVIALIGAISASFLIPAFFGPEFTPAVVPAWILLSSSTLLLPVFCGYSAMTHAHSVTWIAAIIALFGAAANIGLNFALIPRFGMEGCAWATVGSYLVSISAYGILLRLSVDLPLSWLYLAMLPSLASAAIYSATNGALWAAGACLALTGVVILFKLEAVYSSVQTANRLFRNELSPNNL
jgi:O-antigen/teichoic acid export membrane protein